MAPPARKQFVEWEEEYVSNDRGSRVVHYYLKDRHGNARLAVVGTERSLRHMVYVVSDEFLHLANSKKSTTSSLKWRSRREVVDWLTSLLSKPRSTSSGDHITSPQKTWLLSMVQRILFRACSFHQDSTERRSCGQNLPYSRALASDLSICCS